MQKEEFIPLYVEKTTLRRSGRKGSLTMICSAKHGKRLMLSEELAETLELSGTVQIGFIGNQLVMGKHLPGNGSEFQLRRQGKKLIIYSAELIHIIAERQQIDFTDTVSHTWYTPIVDEYENIPVALFDPEVNVDGE